MVGGLFKITKRIYNREAELLWSYIYINPSSFLSLRCGKDGAHKRVVVEGHSALGILGKSLEGLGHLSNNYTASHESSKKKSLIASLRVLIYSYLSKVTPGGGPYPRDGAVSEAAMSAPSKGAVHKPKHVSIRETTN